MDVAERALDHAVERRARNGDQDHDEREELWKESVRRFNARSAKRTASPGATTSGAWPWCTRGGPTRGFRGDTSERCARCGRNLYTVLRVVYEGEGAVADA
jgi:hypothetical protein